LLRRLFLAAAGGLACLCISPALAESGATVMSLKGTVHVILPQGREETLARGMRLETGATYLTAADAAMTLRFDDGQLIALAGDTTYVVNDYAFNPYKPEASRFHSTLMKGGMRAISGLIGEKTPQNLKFMTPAGTIDAQGTDFEVFVDGPLYVSVKAGAILVSNDAGQTRFAADKLASGTIGSAKAAPKQTAPEAFPRPVRDVFSLIGSFPEMSRPAVVKDPKCL
jgi:hypothetical protein